METYLDHGKLVTGKKKADYEFPSTQDFFAMPSNLIPGIGGVSGARVLLGAKASLQAISLINREVPLVQSVSQSHTESFHDLIGQKFLSITAKNAGVVSKVTDQEITIRTPKGLEHYDIYHYYPLGRKSFILNTPIVKVGDKVKAGQVMATSNYTDGKGNMAMGINLRAAIMPYRSGNFEDAWVLSESGAKKLIAEQLIRFRLEQGIMGLEANRNKYVSLFPNKFINKQLATIDADGVVKPGTMVHMGDPVILALAPRTLKSTDIQLGKLSKVMKHAFRDDAQTWELEHPGEVIDVLKSGRLITVNIKTQRGLACGDKLCLTPGHQVLTEHGWKYIGDVTRSDLVYTLNPDNHQIELLQPECTPVYDHDGDMLQITTKDISTLCTPNHKLYVHDSYSSDPTFNLVEAEKLPKRVQFKKDGRWIGYSPELVDVGKDLKVPTRVYLTLLALFIGGGQVFHRPAARNLRGVSFNAYGIEIPQKSAELKDLVAKALDEVGIKRRLIKAKDSIYVYGINWANYLYQFEKEEKKFIPSMIFNWSKEDLSLFYTLLMAIGGVKTETGYTYTTPSSLLADGIQHLCFMIGLAANITVGDEYQVTISKDVEPTVDIMERHDYVGKVHCLTFNKNHIFYVRHNGKAHWTGNSNTFGAKGVCGQIIPDTEAPVDKDGKPVDIMLNAMSITSRVAPALAISLALGKIAEKRGRPVKMKQFITESAVDEAIKKLKKYGLSDTEDLYDPASGSHMKVMTGPFYINRLSHLAEDKVSSRSQGAGYTVHMQPAKAGDEKAKQMGNLGTTALLSHGAAAVLRDIGTIKATKNDEYWRRLKLGLPLPNPEVPFIFNEFIAKMQGSGITVDKKDTVFHIFPQTNEAIKNLSEGEIKAPLTFRVKGETLIPEAGGMFDPSIVGIFGNRWNHINLSMAVPNPVSEEFLRKMLGVTQREYEALIGSGQLKAKLMALDIDKKMTEYKAYLKSGKKTEKETAAKLLAFLTNLKKHNIKPVDLLLTRVPVIPAQFRPTLAQAGKVISADVNTLYRDLMLNNNSLKNLEFVPEDVKQRLRTDQYNAVKAVFGLGDPISTKSREKGLKGLLASTLGIKGGSAKTTMFQSQVVNKPLDLVGRAVLVPDAKLDLDSASIPQDVLWNVYKPFVIRRMVQKGVPSIKAMEYIESRNPLAINALVAELKDRPAIISRDPILHKYNLTAFYLKPNPDSKDKTLKMNPLVYKSFAADADGDQLNINVPVSDDAKQEIKEKMLPTQMLLSPKSFTPAYIPTNESAYGLYTASTVDNHNIPKKYKTEEEVVKDFNSGKLDVGDRVEIG